MKCKIWPYQSHYQLIYDMVTLKGNKVIVRGCKSGKNQKLCNYWVNDNCKPELIKLLLNNGFQIYWSILHRLNHHKCLIIKKKNHSQEFNFSGLSGKNAFCLSLVYDVYIISQLCIFYKNKVEHILKPKEEFADVKNIYLGLCSSASSLNASF